ncbi:MAG: hypothetical protein P8127_02965 [Acidobacteriota bacterium]
MGQRRAGTGDENFALLERVVVLDHAAHESPHLTDVHVGDGRSSATPENTRVPRSGQPCLEEEVQRGVLAPVREQSGKPGDAGGDAVVVLREHLLSDAFGGGVDVVAVRRTIFRENFAGGRELTGRHRRGEDEALETEVAALLEDVAGPLDVGAPVLGVLFTGEVVVRCKVDEIVRAARGADVVEGRSQRLTTADVDFVPRDVLVQRNSASLLRPQIEAHNAEVLLEIVQEVAADEAGRTGDDETRQRHSVKTL